MAEPRRPHAAPVPTPGRVLIVEGRFYEDIADALLAGARRVLDESGTFHVTITVPGALEIAQAAKIALDAAREAAQDFDGIVALGCIIRGETTHYDLVANESARALTDLALNHDIPVGNGILTVENPEQAWRRARIEDLDKGGGAAEAALSLIRLKRRMRDILTGAA